MPGDITLYQSYFATIVSQVSSLMSLIPTIAKGIESVNSIGEVLLEDDIEQNEGKEIIKDIYGEFDFGDNCYKQLIVWNPEADEIIGGYRYLLGKDWLPIFPSVHQMFF